jgi:hypothetical protein
MNKYATLVAWYWQGRRKKSVSRAIPSTTNAKWTFLRQNLGPSYERPATNRLTYDMTRYTFSKNEEKGQYSHFLLTIEESLYSADR